MLECKSCGAQISVEEGQQVVTCPYCGSQNTVSRNMESVGNLFNRANYLRRQNEFDRAIEVYEQILQNSTFEYEAYWGLLLCQYGIEYVEDPATHKRIPTCHRTQTESILQQPNFKKAIQYAPYDVSQVYKAEAAEIDRLQKSILSLAQKQEKYDVFICYKESDEDGERTEDSVIAQELYERLIQRGYKVFFSRKTLEKKLGSAYEPIIYAALNSVQVMIVLGLKPEHFSAVWVRNEWSRYLERMKKNPNLALIPAYRGFSPYELPNEFANLQALDMSKLGFMQELCDGIDRIVGHSMSASMTASSVQVNDQNLVKRGFYLLEEGNFKEAERCFERCLDQNVENADAYLGKLLVEFKCREIEDLQDLRHDIYNSPNYKRAFQYGSPQLQDQLDELEKSIRKNIRKKRKRRKIYLTVGCICTILVIGSGIVVTRMLPHVAVVEEASQLESLVTSESVNQEERTYGQEATYIPLENPNVTDEDIMTDLNACIDNFSSEARYDYIEKIKSYAVNDRIPDEGIPLALDIFKMIRESGINPDVIDSENQRAASSSVDFLVALNSQSNFTEEMVDKELSVIEGFVENGWYSRISDMLISLDRLGNRPGDYEIRVEKLLDILVDHGYSKSKNYFYQCRTLNSSQN